MGARVVKVESLKRPDGARLGPSQFYDLMNGGKESVALDFSTIRGREALLSLIAKADIVIESSRPRALRQLGIFAETLIEKHPGLIWLSITGYGRRGDEANWVAFGDDAGVAAGLNSLISRRGARPIFCGDAIGDPLTGLHGALLAWSRWQSRRGGLLAITLRDVVARCATFDRQSPIANAAEREIEWEGLLSARRISAAPPTARRPENAARPLGADNAKVLRELEVFC
jgi:crotonobetainyl-CoA:carnitine CoA-transferase CaiB-like acyl-CoA transferase